MSDTIISNSDGNDVVVATGPYPGTPVLRFPSGGFGTNGGPGSLIYGQSITPPNVGAGTLAFEFDPPIGRLIFAVIAGIMQLPVNCSVDSGVLVFEAGQILPPADPVTALYVSA